MSQEENKAGLSRRQLLGSTAAAAAAAGAVGAGAITLGSSAMTPALAQARNNHEVKPGELDEYYVFFSGGHSGEVRILGLP